MHPLLHGPRGDVPAVWVLSCRLLHWTARSTNTCDDGHGPPEDGQVFEGSPMCLSTLSCLCPPALNTSSLHPALRWSLGLPEPLHSAPKDVYILTSGTCGYVTLHGKRHFAGVLKARLLTQGDYLGSIPNSITELYNPRHVSLATKRRITSIFIKIAGCMHRGPTLGQRFYKLLSLMLLTVLFTHMELELRKLISL